MAVAAPRTGSARAQNYPSRDITLIVPYNPGGGTDPIARQFAGQLEKELHGKRQRREQAREDRGRSVRASWSGPSRTAIPSGSVPTRSSGFQPLVNTGLVFKKADDYQPIVKLMDQHVNLVVRKDAPWKNLSTSSWPMSEKNPGKIRASVSGKLGQPDLVVQQLNKAAGVKITTVPFTGGAGEALVALLGGRIEANIGTAASTLGHLKAGTIRCAGGLQEGQARAFSRRRPGRRHLRCDDPFGVLRDSPQGHAHRGAGQTGQLRR